MVALVERMVWGVGLKFYHILGMTGIVLCIVLVSLSGLF